MSKKTQLGILISGRGSNMTAIISNCRSNQLDAEVAIVISNQKKAEEANVKRSAEIIEFLGLGDEIDSLASNLSHGHQRQLGVAMALATEPELLMLDEPVAGMNSGEKAVMVGMVKKIRDEWGVTVLLVEHDMRTVMNLCDRITVIDFGEKLAEGTPDEIKNNDKVIEAYLGADDSVA